MTFKNSLGKIYLEAHSSSEDLGSVQNVGFHD